ncbi:MAG: VWA domain-containing protein [Deltaproteobacteria bacterium]|nr:VWA domain-containing protein [Deltaproteobacteria bacterium]
MHIIWRIVGCLALLATTACGSGTVSVQAQVTTQIEGSASVTIGDVLAYRNASQCTQPTTSASKGFSFDAPDISADDLTDFQDDVESTLDSLERTIKDKTQDLNLSDLLRQAIAQSRQWLDDARQTLTQLRTTTARTPYPAGSFVGEVLAADADLPNENFFDRLGVAVRERTSAGRVTVQFFSTDAAGVARDTVTPEQVLIEALDADGTKLGDVTAFTFSNVLTELAAQVDGAFTVSTVNDYSGSMRDDLDAVEAALQGFYDVYPDGLRTEVIKFTGDTTIYYPLGVASGEAFTHALTARPTLGATALYDAITTAITDTCQGSGFKALLVLTDGQDNASAVSLEDTIRFAQANRIPLFVVGFGYADKSVLQRLATETGGVYLYFPYDVYQQLGREQIYQTAYQLFANLFNYSYLASFENLPPLTASLRISVQVEGSIQSNVIALP